MVEQINKNKCSNIGWLFLQYEMFSDFDYNVYKGGLILFFFYYVSTYM